LSLLKEADRDKTEAGSEAVACVALGVFGLGGPKKDVMLALLGFLLSVAEAERWSAVRFNPGLTMTNGDFLLTGKALKLCSTKYEESKFSKEGKLRNLRIRCRWKFRGSTRSAKRVVD
jgi:hypothetical protein